MHIKYVTSLPTRLVIILQIAEIISNSSLYFYHSTSTLSVGIALNHSECLLSINFVGLQLVSVKRLLCHLVERKSNVVGNNL